MLHCMPFLTITWQHGCMCPLHQPRPENCVLMQMSDKENEAGERNAARCVPMEVAAGKGAAPRDAAGSNGVDEEAESAHSRWARHCHATLGAVSAATVLKASR